jgi:hypothetical protein
MAFVTRTWKDRISEYPNRRTINDGTVTKVVTVGRDEGTVTETGDAYNATNMNDLETRIANAIGGAWTEVTGTLTAGQTSLVLSNAAITTSSTIDYYTNYYGVNPVAVSVETGKVTLTFEAQDVDISVKVRVS